MKKLAALTIALALLGCSESPQERAERARKAFADHDYRAAQVDLAAALAASPDDPALLELHARNALAMGDGIAAGASLGKLPDNARPKDFALLQAESALLRELPDEAIAALGSDGSPAASRLRALALLAKDDREGAAKAFDAGLAGAPDGRLLSDYARFSLMSGNVKQARALANRAKAAAPGTIDALLADAAVSVAEGRLAEGLAAYDAASKAYPGNLAALAGKAAVLGDLGRTKEMDAVLTSLAEVRGGGQVAYLQARAEMDGKSGLAIASLPLFSRHRGKQTKALGYPGAYKTLKKRVRALCGIDGERAFHPHLMRHEFVTMVLIATGNLKLAQDLARHTNIQNTQRYAHLAEEDQDRAHKEIFNRMNTQ